MVQISKGNTAKSTANHPTRNVSLDRMIIQHKNSVYRQIVRASQGRKKADVDLLKALLKAYADLHRLEQVEGYRAWLTKTTRLCLTFFSDDSVACCTPSGPNSTEQTLQ